MAVASAAAATTSSLTIATPSWIPDSVCVASASFFVAATMGSNSDSAISRSTEPAALVISTQLFSTASFC